MIDNSMDRIIGDYLEINSDIVANQFNSKFPKFISKWIANKHRKKLVASVEKFRNSEYILTWKNLIELFTYVFNNFEDDHNYGVISKVEMMPNSLEALVEFDSYHALIYFDKLDLNGDNAKFNLVMKYISDHSSEGIDVYLTKLKGTARKTQEFIDELNYVLKNCIADYISEVLNKYMED